MLNKQFNTEQLANFLSTHIEIKGISINGLDYHTLIKEFPNAVNHKTSDTSFKEWGCFAIFLGVEIFPYRLDRNMIGIHFSSCLEKNFSFSSSWIFNFYQLDNYEKIIKLKSFI